MHLYAREPGAVLLPAHREVALRGLNQDVAEQKPDLLSSPTSAGMPTGGRPCSDANRTI